MTAQLFFATEAANWTSLSINGNVAPGHEATLVMGDGGVAFLLGGHGKRPVNKYNATSKTWTSAGTAPTEIHNFQAVYITMEWSVFLARGQGLPE